MTIGEWQIGPGTNVGLSQLLGACLRREAELLAVDRWMPFPQTSCSFAFGKQARPLPIGALFRLWSECPAITGTCVSCGGRVLAYSCGGLASVGSVSACCEACGRLHSRFVGGLPAALDVIGPSLAGTEFEVSKMSMGECFPGPGEPLFRALYDLGEWYL